MSKMRKILLLSFLVLASCNYNRMKGDVGDPAKDFGGPGGQSLEGLDFKAIQTAVIGPRCLGCHSSAGGSQGGLNIETYALVKSHLRRVAYRALEKRDMPAGGLSESQGRLLRAWVDAGAPEFARQGPAEKPETDLGAGWETIRDKVFGAKCMDCHGPANPGGGLDLTSLAMVRAKAAVIFDRVIIRQDMPVNPYPTLNDRERGALLKWFDQGMPE